MNISEYDYEIDLETPGCEQSSGTQDARLTG